MGITKIVRKIGRVLLSCALVAGVFLSPFFSIDSMAATFSENVKWISSGREIYVNDYEYEIEIECNHYLYGNINLTIKAADAMNSIHVYRNNESVLEVSDNTQEDYSVPAGVTKAYWTSFTKLYLYTGYPITFYDKGGAAFTGSMPLEDKYCYYGDSNFRINGTPTRAGYIFKGWYTDSDCTVPYEGETGTIDADPSIVVYALWEADGNSNNGCHVHDFTWQTILEPTPYAEGLERQVCSCGATGITQPLSAFGYLIRDYAPSLIKAAQPGQTVTFEFGEFNSFPKDLMAKLVEKSAQDVTFVFHYEWNHVKQEVTIPAGTPIDLNFEWYGPAKMAELYGAKIL